MSTRFRVVLLHSDRSYAQRAAETAFAELDRLQGRLSRFVEDSDVSRINRLAIGQSTTVHPDTFDCLGVAERIRRETGGVFDVAYASTDPGGQRTSATSDRFHLDVERLRVTALVSGLRLDLGGIGKGFALDRLSALLADWDLDAALWAAGTSTWLARGMPPNHAGWPLTIGSDSSPEPFLLTRGAVSASGMAVRGPHMVDPRTGQAVSRHDRVWATAPAAAVADALSTAFFLMTEADIRAYCDPRPQVSAWLLDHSDSQLRPIRMARFRKNVP
jgi:FAD:protein FMN transferase